MKTVFKAKMNIKFSGDMRGLLNSSEQSFEFFSADGIAGEVTLKRIQLEGNYDTISCIVQIDTDRKRMYPDLEAYLECIKTTLGAYTKRSVYNLEAVRDVFIRLYDDLVFLKEKGAYKVAKDADETYYIVKPDAIQKIINHFDTELQAEAALALQN